MLKDGKNKFAGIPGVGISRFTDRNEAAGPRAIKYALANKKKER